MRPNSTSGSQTQREASSHPSPRESSRTEPRCALRLSNLGQTAKLKHRLRNSNSSNDKCTAARKSTFSKHDCSGLRDPRRRHLICVRPPIGCRSPRKRGPYSMPKHNLGEVAFATTKLKDRFVANEPRQTSAQHVIPERRARDAPRIGLCIVAIEIV